MNEPWSCNRHWGQGSYIAISHHLKHYQLEPPCADVNVSGLRITQTFLFFFKVWRLWEETIVHNSPSSVQPCRRDLTLKRTLFPVSLFSATTHCPKPLQCRLVHISTTNWLISYISRKNFITWMPAYLSSPSSKMETANGYFIIAVILCVSMGGLFRRQHLTARIKENFFHWQQPLDCTVEHDGRSGLMLLREWAMCLLMFLKS